MDGLQFLEGVAAVLVATGAGIYLTEKLLSETAEREGQPDPPPPREDNQNGPSPDFAALIDAINAQGDANRKEEKSEDKGKRLIDVLTLVVLCFTLYFLGCTYYAIRGQVEEMKKVYGPIQKQADAAIASQRAWIAPDRISVPDSPTGPDDFKKPTIYFGNIGNTPTKIYGDFRIVLGNTPWSVHTAANTIEAVHAMDCPHEPQSGHVENNEINEFFGQEIFPGGPGVYHSSRFFVVPDHTSAPPPKPDARNGYWIMGCFYYETAGMIHHTAFCFFTNGERCDPGNYAD